VDTNSSRSELERRSKSSFSIELCSTSWRYWKKSFMDVWSVTSTELEAQNLSAASLVRLKVTRIYCQIEAVQQECKGYLATPFMLSLSEMIVENTAATPALHRTDPRIITTMAKTRSLQDGRAIFPYPMVTMV
jgi:hypothetical protein